jgi:hypothetical protein
MQGNDFSPSDESVQTTNQYTLVVVIGKMAIRVVLPRKKQSNFGKL